MTNKKPSRWGYILKHENKSGRIYTLNITNPNGIIHNTFALTDIDSITTQFDDFWEFKNTMESLFPEWDGTKYWIEYDSFKNPLKLPLVFKDQELLSKLSKENKGKEELETEKELQKYVKAFLFMIKIDKRQYRYLENYNYIIPRLKELVKEYIKTEQEGNNTKINILKLRIERLMANYYVIRRIEIGKKAYSKRKDIRNYTNPFEEPTYEEPVQIVKR